jgi:hypothetical protein
LRNASLVCETVTPDLVRTETGEPVTFHECLGVAGQQIAGLWLAEHPQYVLRRIQCSVGTDPRVLRDHVESPEA